MDCITEGGAILSSLPATSSVARQVFSSWSLRSKVVSI